jgi:dynein intermediate chain 1
MRDIFDEYCRDFERQRQEEASKQRPGAKKVASDTNHAAAAAAVAAGGRGSDAGTSSSSSSSSSSRPDQGIADQQWAALEALLDRMRIVDRMVNQNTYADVAMDFKYWDDTSDALRWDPNRQ